MYIDQKPKGGLSSPAEATLFRQAQAGCYQSLNLLMARHDGLVHQILHRYGLGGLCFSEALLAGRHGLWRAILHYTPERGFAFSTYAWPCIRHQIRQAVRTQTRAESRPEVCWAVIPRPMVEPSRQYEADRVESAVGHLVSRLPQRLRQVIVRRYGLMGQTPATFTQIGATLGVTGARAGQLHTEALIWLRQPAHSQALRSLLERHTTAEYAWADEIAQRWLQRRGGRHGR